MTTTLPLQSWKVWTMAFIVLSCRTTIRSGYAFTSLKAPILTAPLPGPVKSHPLHILSRTHQQQQQHSMAQQTDHDDASSPQKQKQQQKQSSSPNAAKKLSSPTKRKSDSDVGGYDPGEALRSEELNVGDPQMKVLEKDRSVTRILRELAAIQQQGPQKYCILGTRHCSYLHQ